MKSWVRDNGLTIALLALFAASLGGQAITGWTSENQTLLDHGRPPLLFGSYIVSAAFLSALPLPEIGKMFPLSSKSPMLGADE